MSNKPQQSDIAPPDGFAYGSGDCTNPACSTFGAQGHFRKLRGSAEPRRCTTCGQPERFNGVDDDPPATNGATFPQPPSRLVPRYTQAEVAAAAREQWPAGKLMGTVTLPSVPAMVREYEAASAPVPLPCGHAYPMGSDVCRVCGQQGGLAECELCGLVASHHEMHCGHAGWTCLDMDACRARQPSSAPFSQVEAARAVGEAVASELEVERLRARVAELEAHDKRWRVAFETSVSKCETCDGDGVMDAVCGYETTTEREITSAEPCAECGGTGRGGVAFAIAEARKQAEAERDAAREQRDRLSGKLALLCVMVDGAKGASRAATEFNGGPLFIAVGADEWNALLEARKEMEKP